MANEYKVRFKFRSDLDDEIFDISGILRQEKVSDLIRRAKHKMTTRLEEESADDIQLFFDDPRDVEKRMNPEDVFLKI